MKIEQSASINEKSDEEIAKENEERKEKYNERNREYQRAWRQRQKDLKNKKKDSKEEKEEEKRNDLQMKRRKLDSNEDQENVEQCRASQNLENVQLEQNQLLTQQLRIYEESHECITPKVILHRFHNITIRTYVVERTEKEKERNREYQRAWRQRQKDLKKKKKDSKEEKEEEKRNDLQMKRKKLDRDEDQENDEQCRASQNLENVQLLRELHFTPYFSDDEKQKEDERKRKQKNKEYCKRYRDKKRTSNLQTVPSARDVSDVQLDDLKMKRRKLDSNEDQENVEQCRASQNLENVQLEQNQFLTQQISIYEESHECITPKAILHRNTDIPGDGNCLFHSLIRVLQLQISTCDLRRQLRDSPYLNSCHNPQEAYNILSSNNEYGDLDCLYLFAKIYNQNICVHFHYFNVISKNEDTLFCHFKANDTHNWIHLDLRELHFTPYFSDDEMKKEDERKRKQKNKEYCKRYRDNKRTSNLQTGPSARDVLDVQLDDLQMKRRKLDSSEDQENVVQCRDSQNLENVQLEQNQFLTQLLRIHKESHECITPILHRNTDIPDAVKPGSTKWVQYSTSNPQNTDDTCKPQDQGRPEGGADGAAAPGAGQASSAGYQGAPNWRGRKKSNKRAPKDHLALSRSRAKAGAAEDTSKPQDAEDTCKPRDINQTSKPQDTDINFKPQKNILNPFPCNICKLRFPSRLILNTHLLSHEYECHMCKKDFGSKKLFLNHKRVCKPQDTDNTYKLQNTDSKFKAQTQKDILNPFSCHICKLRFLSRQTLNTHLLSHKYVCQMCKIDFGSKNLFLKHKCWLCETCNKPCESFDHKNCPKYSCKICNETFEDSLAATSHSRTHDAPMRSYTRKPKAINAQEKRREPVNIVKEENLSDVPIELDGNPQERVKVKYGHEERWLADVKKEPCYKRSSDDLGEVGMTEPKLRCIKVDLDIAEETRNPNQNGLFTGETSQHLGGVKVEPDLKDEPNESVDIARNTSTLHDPLRDVDMREAVDKLDEVVTEESSKVFEGVKIEPEVRVEIKKEPNGRFELDEVMDEEQDVKPEAELYAGHQIVDGIALGPVRVRAPTVYDGKNAMIAGSGKRVQYSTCNPQEADDTCKPQDTDSTSKSQQDTNARYKPHSLNDTRKPQDIEDTCKSQDTDNKGKLQTIITPLFLRRGINILNICICNICKIRFPSRDILNTHLLSHVYVCGKCEIEFSSKNLFLNHKCCVCKTCNKPCARSNHKCSTVYTCKCGETFTRNRDFTTHQKIHAEISYNCPSCCKQFTNEADLINHVNEMKFPCIYCGLCFPSLEELSAHNVVQPDPPKYSCKMCYETFEDSCHSPQ